MGMGGLRGHDECDWVNDGYGLGGGAVEKEDCNAKFRNLCVPSQRSYQGSDEILECDRIGQAEQCKYMIDESLPADDVQLDKNEDGDDVAYRASLDHFCKYFMLGLRGHDEC